MAPVKMRTIKNYFTHLNYFNICNHFEILINFNKK